MKAGISITISGQGAGATVIDANHIDRAFAVQLGASLSISGVTIENGSQNDAAPSDLSTAAAYGGAFYNDGVLSVSNCAFADNSAYSGGGVVFADTGASATSITNSTVTGNSSGDGYGGALYVESGSHHAQRGHHHRQAAATTTGACSTTTRAGNTVGAVTINQSTISNNVAYYDYGGALYLDDAGALTITGSTFANNVLDYYYGGAIFDEASGELTVSGSTFDGNASRWILRLRRRDRDRRHRSFGERFDFRGQHRQLRRVRSTSTAPRRRQWSRSRRAHFRTTRGAATTTTEGRSTTPKETCRSRPAPSTATAPLTTAGRSPTRALTACTSSTTPSTATWRTRVGRSTSTKRQQRGRSACSTTRSRATPPTTAAGSPIREYANSIENTIVAGNSGGTSTDGGGDCYGPGRTANASAADKGGNIDSDGTCFSNIVSRDQTGVNPDLGPLSNNGGPTETDAELAWQPGDRYGAGGVLPA